MAVGLPGILGDGRSGGAGFWALDHLDSGLDGDTGDDLGQLVLAFRRQVFEAAMTSLKTIRRP